jgi:colicin import membrane protein
VNPASLGTNLPGGGQKGVRTATESTNPPKPPQQVAKKEEPKLPPPIQKEVVKIPEQAKPVEKPPVKPTSEKVKVEEKKLEPKKTEPKIEPPKVPKVEEPKPEAKKPEPKKEEAKTEPEKANPKKVEEKKPEPQQAQTKPQKNEPKPEKVETKPEKEEPKPEVTKPPLKAVEKSTEEKPVTSDAVPSEDRDRQIAAALERIKAQVQPKGNPEFTEGAGGAGPVTKGGAVGEGGGGVARGIEFIMYTQELQRRVQESWIVAEKQPGLVASVSFKIQPDGDVQELELTRSSGDSVFDQSVVRAIRKATPFPPPPQSYAQEFATQKIFMNFGGEGRVN